MHLAARWVDAKPGSTTKTSVAVAIDHNTQASRQSVVAQWGTTARRAKPYVLRYTLAGLQVVGQVLAETRQIPRHEPLWDPIYSYKEPKLRKETYLVC